jgi:protein-S-isoprenylcysteine O-methyltransferase Ste14
MDVANELLFRILFAILWLVFIANLTWIRYSAWRRKSKTRDKNWHGSWIHIAGLIIFAPFWFGGIILYIFLPDWIAFLSIPLPDWLRFIMVGISAVSIPFILWGYQALGKNWVHALEPSEFKQKDGTLVTTGPYGYVRNPIYLGCFVFIIAMALVAANWLLLLPALVLISIVYAQISNEELMLIEKFGDEYRGYMERTPRIIPRLRSSL